MQWFKTFSLFSSLHEDPNMSINFHKIYPYTIRSLVLLIVCYICYQQTPAGDPIDKIHNLWMTTQIRVVEYSHFIQIFEVDLNSNIRITFL